MTQKDGAKKGGGAPARAVTSGVLKLGALEFDCYVLEDEARVLSQSSIVRGLTGKHGSTNLGQYLGRLPAKYAALTASTAVGFTMPQGGNAKGRTSLWFIDLLRAYDEADDAGLLHPKQRHLAKQARTVLGNADPARISVRRGGPSPRAR